MPSNFGFLMLRLKNTRKNESALKRTIQEVNKRALKRTIQEILLLLKFEGPNYCENCDYNLDNLIKIYNKTDDLEISNI